MMNQYEPCDFQYINVKKEIEDYVIDGTDDIDHQEMVHEHLSEDMEDQQLKKPDIPSYIKKLEETLRTTQKEKEALEKDILEINSRLMNQTYELHMEKETVKKLKLEIVKLKFMSQQKLNDLNNDISFYKSTFEQLENQVINLHNLSAPNISTLKVSRKRTFDNKTNNYYCDKNIYHYVDANITGTIMEPTVSLIEQNGKAINNPNLNDYCENSNNNENLRSIIENPVLHKYSRLTEASEARVSKQLIHSAERNNSHLSQTRKRRIWDKDMMCAAVTAVRNKKMGFKKAAKVFNVPKTTLQCYSKQSEENIQKVISRPIGRKTTFPLEIESELVDYCFKIERIFYNISTADLKQIAYYLALKNNIEHPFSLNDSTAGRGWLRRFSNRHPELTKQMQRSSSPVIKGRVNPHLVAQFYLNLKNKLDRIGHNPSSLFYVDETGILFNTENYLNSMEKVSLLKRERMSKYCTSESEIAVSLVSCCSADGRYLKPMLVLQRDNVELELLQAAFEDWMIEYHPSGWTTNTSFTKWFLSFIAAIKPSSTKPIVLIINGYFNVKHNIDLIDLAEKHEVHLLCLPPNSAVECQPLQKSFILEMKKMLSQDLEKWISDNTPASITFSIFNNLLGQAYKKIASPHIASMSFEETGILPYRPDIVLNNDILSKMEKSVPKCIEQKNKLWTSPRKRIKRKRWNSSSDDSRSDEESRIVRDRKTIQTKQESIDSNI